MCLVKLSLDIELSLSLNPNKYSGVVLYIFDKAVILLIGILEISPLSYLCNVAADTEVEYFFNLSETCCKLKPCFSRASFNFFARSISISESSAFFFISHLIVFIIILYYTIIFL